jgi:hypothetical protein
MKENALQLAAPQLIVWKPEALVKQLPDVVRHIAFDDAS